MAALNPSSLTLIGFLRGSSMNVYSGDERITSGVPSSPLLLPTV
jgi:hypothetical protein